MAWLYAIGIRLYGLAIHLAALWSPKAQAWVAGRKDWQRELRQAAPDDGFDFWMHCSSLGEFEQGRPILEGYRSKYPSHQLLLTFYSPSGFEVRKNFEQVDFVSYLPLDTKGNSQQFLAIANPEQSVFVKYDCWPNMMQLLMTQQRSARLIAAQFRSNDLYHGFLKNWTRPLLNAFEKVYLQQGPKIDWLKSAQQIVGDPRVDRVIQIQQAKSLNLQLQDWKKGKVMIWGSVWPKDWPMIRAIAQSTLADWQHLIAPHDIAAEGVAQLQELLGTQAGLFTEAAWDNRLLILNTIGQLSSAYRLGDLAYIGGGLGTGIHNILEPLAAGLPTYFGPKHHKFPEAAAAIEANCGFEVATPQGMVVKVQAITASETLGKAQECAHQFIQSRAGATQIILADI